MKPTNKPDTGDSPHDVNPQKANKLALIVCLGIVFLVSYFFAPLTSQSKEHATGHVDKKNHNSSVPVTITTVTQGDLPIFLTGLGTVMPLQTVTIRSKIDGELLRVHFKEGQAVRQGDLLAEIDARQYLIQVQQHEGQLLRDEALLKNAETDLTRYQTLLRQDSISAQQVATQVALVKQYRGTVKVDQALVNNAKLQVSYSKILAPLSGRVGLRLIDAGNIVHANDSNGLVVISQIQPISVVFTLPEDDITQVMQQWPTKSPLKIDAFDRAGHHKLASGTLLAVDNQIDTTTGTVKLKAQFDNREQRLFANQFVNIKMQVDTLSSVILAKTAAIQHGTMGSFVYLVKNDNTVTVRPVILGSSTEDTVVIVEGLAVNDKLVIDGVDKLREGSQISIIDPNAKPPIAASQAPKS